MVTSLSHPTFTFLLSPAGPDYPDGTILTVSGHCPLRDHAVFIFITGTTKAIARTRSDIRGNYKVSFPITEAPGQYGLNAATNSDNT